MGLVITRGFVGILCTLVAACSSITTCIPRGYYFSATTPKVLNAKCLGVFDTAMYDMHNILWIKRRPSTIDGARVGVFYVR